MLSIACLAGEKYRQVSHLRATFQGCCCVFKTRYSQGSIYKDIPLTLPFRLENSRMLATALESLQLLWTPPLCLPSRSGKKGSLLTYGVSEGTVLPACPPGELPCSACSGSGRHRTAAGSGHFRWTSAPSGHALGTRVLRV